MSSSRFRSVLPVALSVVLIVLVLILVSPTAGAQRGSGGNRIWDGNEPLFPSIHHRSF